jgi:hypothetical protein
VSTMKHIILASIPVFFTQITALVVSGDHGTSLDPLELRQTTSCENTASSRNCWGNYSIDTNYYDVTPDTGVTREVMIYLSNCLIYASEHLTLV